MEAGFGFLDRIAAIAIGHGPVSFHLCCQRVNKKELSEKSKTNARI